jgi:beta-phosphoglucomutase-like phosphatase (HAD superfamily)
MAVQVHGRTNRHTLEYLTRQSLTASGKGNVDFFIEYLDLGRWFNLDQIVYDNGTRRGKPAPDCYRDAAQILGADPAACVVVEDSRSGMAAARAAGIGHIVALGPLPEHERLAQVDGVNRVVADLSQIPRSLFLS